MTPMHVYDFEDLYRSVRPDEYRIVDGRVVISASAFKDRDRKPSVDKPWLDRAVEETRMAPENGVTKLLAKDVRYTCRVSTLDKKGREIINHAVDVLHRPVVDVEGEPNNLAHCQVECHPTLENDGSFKRLKEALAGLATQNGFVLEPGVLAVVTNT
jgi:hypothetical protein